MTQQQQQLINTESCIHIQPFTQTVVHSCLSDFHYMQPVHFSRVTDAWGGGGLKSCDGVIWGYSRADSRANQ